MERYKKFLKKFESDRQLFKKTVLGIVKGNFFEKLSSTNKYFSKKCPWYSRGINTFERNFIGVSIFLPISVLGYM